MSKSLNKQVSNEADYSYSLSFIRDSQETSRNGLGLSRNITEINTNDRFRIRKVNSLGGEKNKHNNGS